MAPFFVRRPIVAIVISILTVLIGLAALAYALVRERALKSESARADSIATFVTGLLNKAVPKLVLQGNSKGIRVLLESADERVSTTLTNSPAAELTVRDALQYLYGGRLDDLISSMKQTDRMESCCRWGRTTGCHSTTRGTICGLM